MGQNPWPVKEKNIPTFKKIWLQQCTIFASESHVLVVATESFCNIHIIIYNSC